MDSSSPQLDHRRRERIEAGLDIALAALRRIAAAVDEVAPASVAQMALAQIEAILPEKARL